MRSAAILASALAVGAIAKPLRHQHKRYILTTVDLDVVTVTKYVTAGYEEPAPTPAAVSIPSKGEHHHSHSDKPAPQPSSVVEPSNAYTPPPVVVSTPAYTPPASSAAAPSSVAAPASSSQAAAPSSGGSAGGYSKYSTVSATSGQDYKDSITFFHNVARSNHGHAEVQWDDSLASVAAEVANTCKFQHWAPADGQNQGQNLFAASGDFGNIGMNLVKGWYMGEYKNMTDSNAWNLAQISNSTFEGSGHLTQMVWKDTQKIGCASIQCSPGQLSADFPAMDKFHVCQYSPPGNYANEYANNVGRGIIDGITSSTDLSGLITKIDAAAKKNYI